MNDKEQLSESTRDQYKQIMGLHIVNTGGLFYLLSFFALFITMFISSNMYLHLFGWFIFYGLTIGFTLQFLAINNHITQHVANRSVWAFGIMGTLILTANYFYMLSNSATLPAPEAVYTGFAVLIAVICLVIANRFENRSRERNKKSE